ncbi:MAG TPA: hypothetical protein VFR78_09365 [Pyrinomonadaceae bacterium]|nr:hypothetical protein [Pyrinomonadaceae bacterium]
MYATISVLLSAMIGLTGTIDVAVQQTKPLDHLAWQYSKRSHIDSVDAIARGFAQDKPIMDPDDGSGTSFEQDKPRLDRFAKAIKLNSSADAYIIAYGGLVSYKNEARIRLRCIRKYLTTTHRISASRLKLIDGGYRVEKAVQLFLVEPGESVPTAFPIVNREAVRITRAPKKKCG